MKRFITGLVFGSVLAGLALAGPIPAAITLIELDGIEMTPTACAAKGGHAALIADIDENGYLTSEWEAFCAVEAK